MQLVGRELKFIVEDLIVVKEDMEKQLMELLIKGQQELILDEDGLKEFVGLE